MVGAELNTAPTQLIVLSTMPPNVADRVRGGASSLPGPQWMGAELYDVSEHFS